MKWRNGKYYNVLLNILCTRCPVFYDNLMSWFPLKFEYFYSLMRISIVEKKQSLKLEDLNVSQMVDNVNLKSNILWFTQYFSIYFLRYLWQLPKKDHKSHLLTRHIEKAFCGQVGVGNHVLYCWHLTKPLLVANGIYFLLTSPILSCFENLSKSKMVNIRVLSKVSAYGRFLNWKVSLKNGFSVFLWTFVSNFFPFSLGNRKTWKFKL